jgi:hypothetical protein
LIGRDCREKRYSPPPELEEYLALVVEAGKWAVFHAVDSGLKVSGFLAMSTVKVAGSLAQDEINKLRDA